MKPRRTSSFVFTFCLLVVVGTVTFGCNKQQAPSDASLEVKPAATMTNATAPAPAVTTPTDSGSTVPKPDINGNHVMQYVKEIVAIGSRPVGSAGHAKLERYILSKLKGVDVEEDKFTARTPVGKFPVS